MTRDEYNKQVQDMQAFCIAAGLEHRVIANESLTGSQFQVYWDGNWRGIGAEYPPFSEVSDRSYNDQLDAKIRYEIAGAVI